MFAAQCSPYYVASGSITSTMVQISWKCFDSVRNTKFTVTYTLTDKDQCNAPENNLNVPNRVDCSFCNRVMSDKVNEYIYYHDLTGLHPYSTYTYSVQARITTDTPM